MAITNHDELKVATRDFNLDDANSDTAFESVLALAEQAIYYGLSPDGMNEMVPLRVREMEAIDTVTQASGVGTVPSAYLQHRRCTLLTSPRQALAWITPEGADELYGSRSSGPSTHFTIIGTELRTFPLSASTSVELTHYAKPATLVGGGTTASTILTAYPGIFIAACSAMFAYWSQDFQSMQSHMNMLKSLIHGANKAHQAQIMATQTVINSKRRLP